MDVSCSLAGRAWSRLKWRKDLETRASGSITEGGVAGPRAFTAVHDAVVVKILQHIGYAVAVGVNDVAKGVGGRYMPADIDDGVGFFDLPAADEVRNDGIVE